MRKRTFSILLMLFTGVVIIGLYALYKTFGSNTGDFKTGEYAYIKTGSSYESVKAYLQDSGFVKDIKSFDFLAKRADYPHKVKAGKYRIEKGMSNYDLIRMLRSGRQIPVKLVIRKLRTQHDFANFVSKQLEPDTADFLRLFTDSSLLAPYGLDSHTALCAIMPDTYEFWWNTPAEKVYGKIASYYQKYWTKERKALAEKLHLTPAEVIILASIVEEETNNHQEKDTIASVYLNRLQKGMKLQADPTARFAYGDFSVRRITNIQTSFPSPYNTYYALGLPPGPICTPSKKSIEAVLHVADTDYLYFCAKEDFSGSHRFAKDYATHQQNARRFQQALNERGIR